MRMRAWVAAALMAAFFAPAALADVSADETTVRRYVADYCAPSGPREALSRRGRENLRVRLEHIRAIAARDWQRLPDKLGARADRILDHRDCG